MGVFRRRPTNWAGNGGAGGQTSNSQSALGDQSDSSYVFSKYSDGPSNPGAATTSYAPVTTQLPSGRRVVAVKVGQRIRQQNTFTTGAPAAYLRTPAGRVDGSMLYQRDFPIITSWRDQVGPAAYKSGNQPWTLDELNSMGTEHVAYTNLSNPGKYDRNFDLSEAFMDVIYEEPLTDPASITPAGGSTIATSNPRLGATIAAPQQDQPVRLVIELSRASTFTNSKVLVTDYSNLTSPTSIVEYTGQADLGPGLWYRRVKAQDIIGNETAWTATTSFTVAHDALPAPAANTSPASGSIVVNPYAVRTSRVETAPSDARRVGVEWQFSKSATFASGIVTWKNLQDTVITGNVSYDPLPLTTTQFAPAAPGLYGGFLHPSDPSQYLAQGLWNMRSRTVDKWGQTSAWGETTQFTVQHQPVAQNVTPASNQVIDRTVTPARWTFGDPWSGDAQTAFRVRAYAPDNTMVVDSTKITGASGQALQYTMNIPVAYLYQQLRMTIELWDKDDVTSSTVQSYFFVNSTSPQITMPNLANNGVINSGQPKFEWNPGIARPGTTQKTWELRVVNRATNALVYTSGVRTGKETSHIPPTTILRNGGSYQLTLRIVDSDNLNSTLTRNFTAAYDAPPDVQLTVDPQPMLTGGHVHLDWGLSNPTDYFAYWSVFRRELGTTAWTPVAVIDDSSVKSYNDWLVPSVGKYQWTVTQTESKFNEILTSSLDENAPSNFVYTEEFWLIDPDDETNNIRVYSVSDNQYTDAYEQSEYHVKGRGMHVNFGDRLGISGTFTVKVRPRSGYTPTQFIRMVREFAGRRHSFLMRDPFGNITKVVLKEISMTQMAGTGIYEYGDLTIPYQEVY